MHSVAYLVSAHLIFDLRLSQAYLEKYSSISASTTFFNKRGRREHGFTTHEQWGLLPQSPCHYLLLLRPPITRGLPVGLCDHHHHPSRDSPPSLLQTALGSSPLCPTSHTSTTPQSCTESGAALCIGRARMLWSTHSGEDRARS